MGDAHPPYLTLRSLSSTSADSAVRTAYTSMELVLDVHSAMDMSESMEVLRISDANRTKYASAAASSESVMPSATHDISRVNYHIKHIESFAKTLEDSATRAFPNRGRTLQRYTKVIALLVHWKVDDLFVLPELLDLRQCFRDDYGFETDIFAIPSENAHLELMMRIGSLIKDYEEPETLFVFYYGGHARIDESRQSTWCATRNPNSPSLQWSAIQTLFERSISDTLILLDCCAGAASATFPTGKSITETISASSWDAIAPDPGSYSFTTTLIRVLQEWRLRTYSAAMLHAEVLARLKHPRPIIVNGMPCEARSTPVHFMMTSNHRAPSIELCRLLPANRQLPSPPLDPMDLTGTGGSGLMLPAYGAYVAGPSGGRSLQKETVSSPNEDEPHVMISLALEGNQELDLGAWEQWLSSFPALAKYVKVQGVFKSHSTLLLLSLPVMVWDLLPEDGACSFVAFIRSDNLIKEQPAKDPAAATTSATATATAAEVAGVTAAIPTSKPSATPSDLFGAQAREPTNPIDETVVSDLEDDCVSGDDYDYNDTVSVISGTTFAPTVRAASSIRMSMDGTPLYKRPPQSPGEAWQAQRPMINTATLHSFRHQKPEALPPRHKPRITATASAKNTRSQGAAHSAKFGQSKKTFFSKQVKVEQHAPKSPDSEPDSPRLSQQVVNRLEEYFQEETNPSVAITEFFASNFDVEKRDIDLWFQRRREQELTTRNLQSLTIVDQAASDSGDEVSGRMILPGHLNKLLDIFPANQLLFVDLRSPASFDRSHIYGAVNLTVPVSFVENCFDLIQLAFGADDQSRRNFAKAPMARCIVFYDRVLEFPWECPMADVLAKQLRENGGWGGDYYILKGHYREFSASFDKYITGDKITKEAKDYADSLRQREAPLASEVEETEENYTEWKTMVEHGSRLPPAGPLAQQNERWEAVVQHQADLEVQLESRNPGLYKKALNLRPEVPKSLLSAEAGRLAAKQDLDATYPTKEARADLVEPLARGLEKMHETNFKTPNYDKLAQFGDEPSPPSLSEDFDEIDPRDEQYQKDPAFVKAGHMNGPDGVGMGRGGLLENDPRRARTFWKRLRQAK